VNALHCRGWLHDAPLTHSPGRAPSAVRCREPRPPRHRGPLHIIVITTHQVATNERRPSTSRDGRPDLDPLARLTSPPRLPARHSASRLAVATPLRADRYRERTIAAGCTSSSSPPTKLRQMNDTHQRPSMGAPTQIRSRASTSRARLPARHPPSGVRWQLPLSTDRTENRTHRGPLHIIVIDTHQVGATERHPQPP
jgi:hypothetical protein